MGEEHRVVSLISSATEMVFALGMGERLVGRSHECDYPESVADLPVCTRPRIATGGDSRQIDELVRRQLRDAISVYEVFPDVLERLQPTHILTQVQCQVCAVSLKDVEDALAAGLTIRPVVVPLNPNSLADVFEDIRRVARALEIPERGEALVARLRRQMSDLWGGRPPGRGRPRVACLEWLEPLMAAGNWVPELVEMAGGVYLFGQAGKHSPYLQWEDLVAADPDVIVVAPCGWDVARIETEMHWLTRRPEWPCLKAVREGRVHLADGNQFFNRPGPRLVQTLEILVELVQGASATFPNASASGSWSRRFVVRMAASSGQKRAK